MDDHFYIKMERRLQSLPVKYCGMGIVIFCDNTEDKYNNSTAVIASLKFQLEQNTIYNENSE